MLETSKPNQEAIGTRFFSVHFNTDRDSLPLCVFPEADSGMFALYRASIPSEVHYYC
jgi:hypothetical protein